MDETENCWICEEAFATEDLEILDHCNFSRKLLGYARTLCNLHRQRNKFTPVFALKLANNDFHRVILALKSGSENNTISVIPINEEKYVSLSLKIWLGSYTTNKGHFRHKYEEMRFFLNSYKFMHSSLDTIAKNLPKKNFVYLDDHFCSNSEEEKDLLRQKAYFPYSYITSFEKYDEPDSPPPPPQIYGKINCKGMKNRKSKMSGSTLKTCIQNLVVQRLESIVTCT